MIDSSKLQAALSNQKQVMQTLDTVVKEKEVVEEVPSGVLPTTEIETAEEIVIEAPTKTEEIVIEAPSGLEKAEEIVIEAPNKTEEIVIEAPVKNEEVKIEAPSGVLSTTDIEIEAPTNTEAIKTEAPTKTEEVVIYADTPKHLEDVLDKTGVDLITPSEYIEPVSGTIKSYKAKVGINYPFIQLVIDDVESFPDRLLKSINNILDKETNDNQKIVEEKRITVGMKVILRTGQVKEGILGTLERKRLVQFLNLIKNIQIEGYLKPDKQIEKKYLYALA